MDHLFVAPSASALSRDGPVSLYRLVLVMVLQSVRSSDIKVTWRRGRLKETEKKKEKRGRGGKGKDTFGDKEGDEEGDEDMGENRDDDVDDEDDGDDKEGMKEEEEEEEDDDVEEEDCFNPVLQTVLARMYARKSTFVLIDDIRSIRTDRSVWYGPRSN